MPRREANRRTIRGALSALALCCAVSLVLTPSVRVPAQAATSEELAVIVHPSRSGSAPISRAELLAIYTTRARTWNGRSVEAFNLPQRDPSRGVFDAVVLGVAPDRITRFWIDARVRTGTRPPRTAPSADVMVRLVAVLPDGIGYVPSRLLTRSVKVVARIRDGRVTPP